MKKTALILFVSLLFAINLATAQSDYLSLKWDYQTDGAVTSIYPGDIEGIGEMRIVVGSSETTFTGGSGWVYLLDKNGKQLDKENLPGPVPKSSNMLVDDLDNDGFKEIIAGVYSYVRVLNSNNSDLSERWESRTGYQYIVKDIAVDDLDNDRIKEIIAVAGIRSKNGVFVFNSDGSKKWASGVTGRPYSVYITDLENDESRDIIVGTVGGRVDPTFGYPAFVYAFNSTGGKKWDYKTDNGINYISADDIDGDGKKEVLAGSYPNLYVLNYDGTPKWNYTTGGCIREIIVKDIDKDNEPEIILGSSDVYALNNKGELKWKNPVGSEVYDMDVVDIDGDGIPEILVGSSSTAYILSNEGETVWTYETGGLIHDVDVADLDYDGYNEILIGSADHKVYVFQSREHVLSDNADELYESASNLYRSMNLTSAIEHAQKAREVYSELNDQQGISRVETLINSINDKLREMETERVSADDYYQKAIEYLNREEYMNASACARKARNKYTGLGDTESVERCDSIIENANGNLKLNARRYYKDASRAYNSRNYEIASSLAQKARDAYLSIRDFENLKTVDLLIAKIYYSMSERCCSEGKFKEANSFIQKSRYIYLCIDSNALNCDSSSIEIKDIAKLADESINQTYNDSKYRDELLAVNSLIMRISREDTGGIEIKAIYSVVGITGLILIAIFLVFRKRKRKKEIIEKPEVTLDKEIKKTEKIEEKREEKRERRVIKRMRKDTSRGAGLSIKGAMRRYQLREV